MDKIETERQRRKRKIKKYIREHDVTITKFIMLAIYLIVSAFIIKNVDQKIAKIYEMSMVWTLLSVVFIYTIRFFILFTELDETYDSDKATQLHNNMLAPFKRIIFMGGLSLTCYITCFHMNCEMEDNTPFESTPIIGTMPAEQYYKLHPQPVHKKFVLQCYGSENNLDLN